MKIEEMEKLLKSKKDERLKLYKEIIGLQIKLDIKKHLNRIYLDRNKGFMCFLLHRNKKINAEYIVPMLNELQRDNIIISKEMPLVDIVKILKKYYKEYKDQLKSIKVKE